MTPSSPWWQAPATQAKFDKISKGPTQLRKPGSQGLLQCFQLRACVYVYVAAGLVEDTANAISVPNQLNWPMPPEREIKVATNTNQSQALEGEGCRAILQLECPSTICSAAIQCNKSLPPSFYFLGLYWLSFSYQEAPWCFA